MNIFFLVVSVSDNVDWWRTQVQTHVANSQRHINIKTTLDVDRPDLLTLYLTSHRILGTGLIYMHTASWSKRFVACSSSANWLLPALFHSPTCFLVILFRSSSDECPQSALSSVECIVCPLDTAKEKPSRTLSCVKRIGSAESTAWIQQRFIYGQYLKNWGKYKIMEFRFSIYFYGF